MKKILCFVLGRTWVMPVLALLGSIICMVCHILLGGHTIGAEVELRHRLKLITEALQLVHVVMFFGLPLWLLVLTVYRLVKRQYHAMWAWLWSAISWMAMLFILIVSSFVCSFSYYDDFALGHKLPEDMTPENTPGMAVPLDFSFRTVKEKKMPEPVRKWKELVEEDSSMCISGDEQLSESAPNVEKLVAEAPELLLEYKLRAACHRALTPGTRVVPHLSILRYAGEHTLGEECRVWQDDDDDVWEKNMQNGWKIRTRCFNFNHNPVPTRLALKKLQVLDEGLAPLAANPTREGLDALVPPLPDKPTIVLREDFQPGIYKVLLVVPRDYPEGTFHVTACEYTQKEPLSMEALGRIMPEPYRNICKLAATDDFTVYSGEWGEMYASTWELHFTPAAGGESRCVNSQLYLLQGWSR